MFSKGKTLDQFVYWMLGKVEEHKKSCIPVEVLYDEYSKQAYSKPMKVNALLCLIKNLFPSTLTECVWKNNSKFTYVVGLRWRKNHDDTKLSLPEVAHYLQKQHKFTGIRLSEDELTLSKQTDYLSNGAQVVKTIHITSTGAIDISIGDTSVPVANLGFPKVITLSNDDIFLLARFVDCVKLCQAHNAPSRLPSSLESTFRREVWTSLKTGDVGEKVRSVTCPRYSTLLSTINECPNCRLLYTGRKHIRKQHEDAGEDEDENMYMGDDDEMHPSSDADNIPSRCKQLLEPVNDRELLNQIIREVSSVRPTDGLMIRMYSMQQSGQMCDTVLESSEGTVRSTHACVLAASSPSLHSMLRPTTPGFYNAKLSLTDDQLDSLIRTIYTGGHGPDYTEVSADKMCSLCKFSYSKSAIGAKSTRTATTETCGDIQPKNKNKRKRKENPKDNVQSVKKLKTTGKAKHAREPAMSAANKKAILRSIRGLEASGETRIVQKPLLITRKGKKAQEVSGVHITKARIGNEDVVVIVRNEESDDDDELPKKVSRRGRKTTAKPSRKNQKRKYSKKVLTGPFTCNKCGGISGSLPSFKIHCMLHGEVKPRYCAYCSRSFHTTVHLLRHRVRCSAIMQKKAAKIR